MSLICSCCPNPDCIFQPNEINPEDAVDICLKDYQVEKIDGYDYK